MSRAIPLKAKAPAFPGYEKAFQSLEGPINRAQNIAKVQRLLADMIREGGTADFIASATEALAFLAEEGFHAVDALDDLWLEHHNAACTAEMPGVA